MEAKKSHKTYQFSNMLEWTDARRGLMTLDAHDEVEVGAPPEFKGTPDVWCPEELLTGALNTCLMLTFLSYAPHKSLAVLGYKSSAEATVEHKDGKYRVTRIQVRPRITLRAGSDPAAAGEVLKSAKEGCFISNSVLAIVELEPEFVVKAPNSHE